MPVKGICLTREMFGLPPEDVIGLPNIPKTILTNDQVDPVVGKTKPLRLVIVETTHNAP
jgi:hypothetical protein